MRDLLLFLRGLVVVWSDWGGTNIFPVCVGGTVNFGCVFFDGIWIKKIRTAMQSGPENVDALQDGLEPTTL